MTVTKISLLSVDGGDGANGPEYSAKFKVSTDDRADGPLTVRNALAASIWNIRYGQPFIIGNDIDLNARCVSIKETQLTNAHYLDWLADVNWAMTEREENPLSEPVKENVSWQGITRKLQRRGDGTPILDPLGLPYGEGLEAEDNQPIITYQVNQATYPIALAQALRNAVNSTAWKGFPPETVKVSSMTFDRKRDKSFGVYYEGTYNFAINPEGYRKEILARSFYYRDGANKLRRFMDGGFPSRQPYMVDAAGKPTDTPYYVKELLNPLADFNAQFPHLT